MEEMEATVLRFGSYQQFSGPFYYWANGPPHTIQAHCLVGQIKDKLRSKINKLDPKTK